MHSAVRPGILGKPESETTRPAASLALLASIVTLLAYWNYRVSGATSSTVVAALALLLCLYLVYGNLASRLLAGHGIAQTAGFSFQLLAGYFVANTLLFIAAIFSPLPILANLLLLAVVGIALSLWSLRWGVFVASRIAWPEVICVAVSGIGATLWCNDSLGLPLIDGDTTVYRIWSDAFFHIRQISMFAQSQGMSSMSDVQMAGARPALYHYSIYLSPAVLSSLGDIKALEAYTGFLLPFGVMLTGLAAFVLIASIWGPWPGAAATFAVVLLPDAFYQGFGNKFMGAQFLNQVNIGGMYGVALAALAWLFMLSGCKSRRLGSVLLAWVLAVFCLIYKAQIAVANAFLIMVFPFIFFTAIKARWRWALGLLAVTAFVSAVRLTQGLPGVPTLRLDGSGASEYSLLLFKHYAPGPFKELYFSIIDQPSSKLLLGLGVASMILLSTFGLWLPLLAAGLWLQRANVRTGAFWLPVLVVGNYLVMSLGLALEKNGIGMGEEFLHRPLVWAAFVVCAWSTGAAYFACFGNQFPSATRSRLILGTWALLASLSPIAFSSNIQTLPVWSWGRTYTEVGGVPTCVVSASNYIRSHGRPDEVVQDAAGDVRLGLTALAERQAYVIFDTRKGNDEMPARAPRGAAERRREVEGMLALDNADQIKSFALTRGVSWLLLHPESRVSWPEPFLNDSAFSCESYRLYRFDQARRAR